MQIPILNGIVTDPQRPDFRTAYPVNMVPVPKEQGISAGYLRPAEGVEPLGTHSYGRDRGAIVWNGVCYRVLGSTLVTVTETGAITALGEVCDDGKPVKMDRAFDRIGVVSDRRLWYCTGSEPFPVTDADIGTVIDAIAIGGYWMVTDGETIAVTDLANPMVVNPLRYGSSELDADKIVGLRKVRDEAYAINAHTIEGFRNVGGTGFPFQVIQGSQVLRGAVGTHAAAVADSAIAFVGGGLGEAPSVYMATNGESVPIATREIEQTLEAYTDAQLATIVMEQRALRGHAFLYVHLPDKTLVYDSAASRVAKEHVWHVLQSGLEEPGRYLANNFALLNNRWIVGDPTDSRLGIMTDTVMTHYGDAAQWEFSVPIMYGDGNSAQVHELELVALTGRVALGADPVIWTSHSADGANWGQERPLRAGKQGEFARRLAWLQQGAINHWRAQRFRGTSDAAIAFARLEARLEALNTKRG